MTGQLTLPRTFLALPTDILLLFFAHLPARSLCRVSRTCRQIHTLINDNASTIYRTALHDHVLPGVNIGRVTLKGEDWKRLLRDCLVWSDGLEQASNASDPRNIDSIQAEHIKGKQSKTKYMTAFPFASPMMGLSCHLLSNSGGIAVADSDVQIHTIGEDVPTATISSNTKWIESSPADLTDSPFFALNQWEIGFEGGWTSIFDKKNATFVSRFRALQTSHIGRLHNDLYACCSAWWVLADTDPAEIRMYRIHSDGSEPSLLWEHHLLPRQTPRTMTLSETYLCLAYESQYEPYLLILDILTGRALRTLQLSSLHVDAIQSIHFISQFILLLQTPGFIHTYAILPTTLYDAPLIATHLRSVAFGDTTPIYISSLSDSWDAIICVREFLNPESLQVIRPSSKTRRSAVARKAPSETAIWCISRDDEPNGIGVRVDWWSSPIVDHSV